MAPDPFLVSGHRWADSLRTLREAQRVIGMSEAVKRMSEAQRVTGTSAAVKRMAELQGVTGTSAAVKRMAELQGVTGTSAAVKRMAELQGVTGTSAAVKRMAELQGVTVTSAAVKRMSEGQGVAVTSAAAKRIAKLEGITGATAATKRMRDLGAGSPSARALHAIGASTRMLRDLSAGTTSARVLGDVATSGKTLRDLEVDAPSDEERTASMLSMFGSWAIVRPLELVRSALADPSAKIGASQCLVDAVAKAVVYELDRSGRKRRKYKNLGETVAHALQLLGYATGPEASPERDLASSLRKRAARVADVRRKFGDAHGHWPDAVPPSAEVAEATVRDALAVAEELARLFYVHLGRAR